MRYADALAEIGGLSSPSKMPCRGWSTPAKRCIVGSLLAKQPGTICSACYARKGMYILPNVEAALERRFARLQEALRDHASAEAFVEAFNAVLRERLRRTKRMIERTGRPGRDDGRYFRWHDSGDLHGTQHLGLLVHIACDNPGVTFWLPTKEVGVVLARLRAGHTLPANLRVRLSLPRIGQEKIPAPYLEAARLSPSVTLAGAHEADPAAGFERCGAPQNGGSCGDCRACWTPTAISYLVH